MGNITKGFQGEYHNRSFQRGYHNRGFQGDITIEASKVDITREFHWGYHKTSKGISQ